MVPHRTMREPSSSATSGSARFSTTDPLQRPSSIEQHSSSCTRHDVDGVCYRVEGLTACWIAQRAHLFEAATLLAGAASTRAELGAQPIGEELELVEHGMAEARRLLAEEPYAAAIATGSAMPISEAVRYALAVE